MSLVYQTSKWETERINGGVTGVGYPHFFLDGRQVNHLYLPLSDQWELKKLCGRASARLTHTSDHGTGVVGMYEASVELTPEWEEKIKACLAHEARCDTVRGIVPIPPHWRRWDFVGLSVEQMTAQAQNFWADHDVAAYRARDYRLTW